jgi:hypothetical protein
MLASNVTSNDKKPVTDFEKCKVQYELDIKACYNQHPYMLICPCEYRVVDAYTLCQKLALRKLA